MNRNSKPKSLAQRNFKSPLAQQFKSPLNREKTETHSGSNSELEEQIEALKQKLKETDSAIQELESSGYKESELQSHIDKLHEYNEIKDAGQEVLGRIAVLEGVQTKDLYPRYGMDLKD